MHDVGMAWVGERAAAMGRYHGVDVAELQRVLPLLLVLSRSAVGISLQSLLLLDGGL